MADHEASSVAAPAAAAEAATSAPARNVTADKVAAGNKVKEEGNAFFKAGDFKAALGKYKLVYFHVGTLGSKHEAHRAIIDSGLGASSGDAGMAKAFEKKQGAAKLSAEEQKAVDDLIATTNANLAMSQINLKQHDGAIRSCNIALLYQPDNAKVTYRRGLAYMAKGDTDSARADFEATLKLVPGDGNTIARLDELRAAEKAQEQKQKRAMQAMFSGALSS
jgi:tetratricopeptide (TPR) repeat protein